MARKLNKDELEHAIKQQETVVLGLEARYASESDERERIIIEYELDKARKQLDEFNDDLDAFTDKEESARDSKHWKKDREQVLKLIEDLDMGYLVEENKIIYCKDFGKNIINPQVKTFTLGGRKLVRWFENEYGKKLRGADEERIIDLFINHEKTYNDVRASFDTNKWSERSVYNKMDKIRKFWVEPAGDGTYDEAFDFLLYCLGGGKQENIDHLEKWVLMKYFYPEFSSATPNIDLGGGAGGTGKNTFVNLLKTVFTSSCIVQAHREELDKFNGGWENALVLYYDEPEEKELELGKLKKATGEKDMRLEQKGKDAVITDRNYNFLFLSNNPKGVVQLSGGSASAEDRRFSVIYTSTTMADEAERRGIQDANKYIENIWNNLIENREEVARWMMGLVQRHSAELIEGKKLQALHGEDYHARFDKQKDDITRAFDKITPVVVKNGVIAKEWLTDLVRNMTENDSWKAKNVAERYESYLKKAKIEFEARKASIAVDGTRAHVQAFVLADTDKIQFEWRDICSVSYEKYKSQLPGSNIKLEMVNETEENKVIPLFERMDISKIND